MKLATGAILSATLAALLPVMLSTVNALQQPSAPVTQGLTSYYPHWVTRGGDVPDEILSKLGPETTIGAHHAWEMDTLRYVLEYPEKRFKIAWYAESNVYEQDDPTTAGTSVATRIAEARNKQEILMKDFGADRFTNLIELDAAREKKDGQLLGAGNEASAWLTDAMAVKAAGYRYIAKRPRLAHLRELRQAIGQDFVAHVVFEDVAGGSSNAATSYARDAKAIAARGEPMTIVLHEGAYGGYQATPLEKAKQVIFSNFNIRNVEAYWGGALADDRFVKLRSFEIAAFN
jgi:hypothetical protein